MDNAKENKSQLPENIQKISLIDQVKAMAHAVSKTKLLQQEMAKKKNNKTSKG